MANLASCCDLAGDERRTAAERKSPADTKTFLSLSPAPFFSLLSIATGSFCGGNLVLFICVLVPSMDV